jgi:glutamine synthetase
MDNYTKSSGNAGLAKAICETIGEDHREHMAAYGAGNEQRLVGKTGGISDFNKFTWGYGDRTASLCVPTVPLNRDAAHLLYIEDRRPGANVDPYAGVLALSRSLVKTINLAPSTKNEAFEPKLVK